MKQTIIQIPAELSKQLLQLALTGIFTSAQVARQLQR